jgi:hypothetical protein
MELPLRAGAVPHADGHLSNVSTIESEGERWDFVGLSRKDPTLNLLGTAVAIETYQIYCIYHYLYASYAWITIRDTRAMLASTLRCD